ncbi:hypothetical protein D0817_12285 [Flavobacterium cupreum]|uniref:Uncharacterized protein n=1 Tax=Flavobacterium cupreum TaxID=2133766 RepID=A0A434A6C7_9FLAO|nr:hypothetical protein [Flavobacterium cupreum]RUT69963.1 hypothetical protein D0817_12285 [Flavobacterium cupreum]
MQEENVNSFLENLKQKVKNQNNYGGKTEINKAQINVRNCPNCGAGRAKQDGVTHCSYCGFEFINTKLTDGVYIKKEDNSI